MADEQTPRTSPEIVADESMATTEQVPVTAEPVVTVEPQSEEIDSPNEEQVPEIAKAQSDAEGNGSSTDEHDSFGAKFKRALVAWWRSPRQRYGTIGAVLTCAILLLTIQPTRAFIMNAVGIRSSVMLSVVDQSTKLPIESAMINIGGKSAKTDASGQVTFRGLHVGSQDLTISKPGFATHTKNVRLGMRVTDLGDIRLRPVGQQLRFIVTDYLSGKPVSNVDFVSGEATTKSDDKGHALLTLASTDNTTAPVTISSQGYRTEKHTVQAGDKGPQKLRLVPSAKLAYISKKSGRYDVYKVDVDGKNEAVLLPGTGLEGPTIRALASPDNQYVAVVSSRENKRNSQGYLLNTLTLVDIKTGEAQTIQQAEQLNIIGWVDNTIVFQETSIGASAANPNRQKILSYNTESGNKKQLASANYFNDALLIGDSAYYTVSATDVAAKDSFVKIDIDGSNRKAYYSQDLWSLVREDYTNFKLQTPTKWLIFNTESLKVTDSVPPNDMYSRAFVDGPKRQRSAWVDTRDTVGVLMIRNLAIKQDRQIASMKNLQGVVSWLNERVVVVRVANYSEVADYVVSLDGGEPVKVADVSNTPIR